MDAFYLAGPGVLPPNGLRLTAGASTTCTDGGTATFYDAGASEGRTHNGGDAAGWGRFGRDNPAYDPSVAPGSTCGHCLVPIDPSDCPTPEVLQSMMTCDNVTLGEMCEADGVLARGRGEVMVRVRDVRGGRCAR